MEKVNINQVLREGGFRAFHWNLLLCGLLILTFDGYDMVVYGASLPQIMQQWRIDPAYAGLIGTCVLLGAGIGSILFGRMADTIGRKRTVLVCAIIFTLAMICAGACPGPLSFAVFRVLAGLGVGGSIPNIIALTSEWNSVERRNVAVTAICTGAQWGGIIASLAGIWLQPLYGWRSLYYFGGVTVFLLPLLWSGLPENPSHLVAAGRWDELARTLKRARPELELPRGTEYEFEKAAARSPIADVFREHRAFSTAMFSVVYFCSLCAIYGLNIWLPKLMMNAGYPLGSSLTFLLVFNLGSIVLNVGTAALADRIGPRRVLIPSYLLGFIAVMALVVKTSTPMLYLLVTLAGVFTMGSQNLLQAYVSQYFPPAVRSTGMGFCFFWGRLGAMFGPALGGFLLQWNVSLRGCFLAFALPSLVSFFAFLVTQDRYSHERQTIS